MSKTNNQAAIVGIGQTEFSKDSGRSEQQLAAEAVIAACEDAGINPEEIDGCITYTIDNSDEVDLLRSVGCKGTELYGSTTTRRGRECRHTLSR